MTTPSTPANWYPDPEDAGSLRYWDGTGWTEHRAPASAPPTPQAPQAPQAEAPAPGAHRAPDAVAGSLPYEPAPGYQEPPSASYEQPPASPGPNKKLIGILGGVAAIILVAALVLVYFFVIKDDDTTTTATTSSSKTSASTSKTTTSKSSPTSTATPTGGQTIDEYAAANGITQTVTAPEQDGAPPVNLPTPAGWEMTTADLPEGSYGAITYTGADADPVVRPTVYAFMSKLTGNVDVNTIFALAPNELLSLDDYQPVSDGAPSDLGGFQSYELAGTYLQEGTELFIAQNTVLIPAGDGVYLLRLYGYSTPTPDQQDILGTALTAIGSETTIG